MLLGIEDAWCNAAKAERSLYFPCAGNSLRLAEVPLRLSTLRPQSLMALTYLPAQERAHHKVLRDCTGAWCKHSADPASIVQLEARLFCVCSSQGCWHMPCWLSWTRGGAPVARMASLQPSRKLGTSGWPCAVVRKVKRRSHHVLLSCSPSCGTHDSSGSGQVQPPVLACHPAEAGQLGAASKQQRDRHAARR